MRHFFVCAAAACLAGTLLAQDVVTAKAGLVHYMEGDVTLDGAMLSTKPGKFAEMKKGSVLKTMEGRVEVLLAPGSSVRLSESSALKMISTSLEDTRLAITAGSVVVEVGDLDKFMSIIATVGESEVTLRKKGVYQLQADPSPSIRVFEGEASPAMDGKSTMIGRGRTAALGASGEFILAKFDAKNGDELYRWAKRRSYYMSMANLSAANSLHTQGMSMGSLGSLGMGGLGMGFSRGGWMYNPYFGMFTYIPMNGMYQSPWGFGYFSPRQAYDYIAVASNPSAYNQNSRSAYSGYEGTGRMNTTYDSNLGYSTSPTRSSGGYVGGSSSPAAVGGDSGMRGGGGSGAVAAPSGDGGGSVRGGGGGGGGAAAPTTNQ